MCARCCSTSRPSGWHIAPEHAGSVVARASSPGGVRPGRGLTAQAAGALIGVVIKTGRLPVGFDPDLDLDLDFDTDPWSLLNRFLMAVAAA